MTKAQCTLQAHVCTISVNAHTFYAMSCVGTQICTMHISVTTYYSGQKKKNHHRGSRREKRCSTCDIMFNQARSTQGKSDPWLSATFALRWLRLIEHDITRGTAFFSPRISRMVIFFFVQARSAGSRYDSLGSTRAAKKNACGLQRWLEKRQREQSTVFFLASAAARVHFFFAARVLPSES